MLSSLFHLLSALLSNCLSNRRPNAQVYGREAGTGEFGAYSDANKTSGIVWSDKHMYEYLVNPKKYIVGTKMVFAGMKKDSERADLCAFLGDPR